MWLFFSPLLCLFTKPYELTEQDLLFWAKILVCTDVAACLLEHTKKSLMLPWCFLYPSAGCREVERRDIQNICWWGFLHVLWGHLTMVGCALYMRRLCPHKAMVAIPINIIHQHQMQPSSTFAALFSPPLLHGRMSSSHMSSCSTSQNSAFARKSKHHPEYYCRRRVLVLCSTSIGIGGFSSDSWDRIPNVSSSKLPYFDWMQGF